MLGLALKELTAQVLEVAWHHWVMTRSRLCPWKRFAAVVWRGRLLGPPARRPSGWQAGMLAMSSTGVYQSCRENWGSSSLSHFSRPLFPHPVMWELTFHSSLCISGSMCLHSGQLVVVFTGVEWRASGCLRPAPILMCTSL